MTICTSFLRAGQREKRFLAYLPRHISPQTMLVSGKTTTFLVAQDDNISVYFCLCFSVNLI
jgi:hypothetical protein